MSVFPAIRLLLQALLLAALTGLLLSCSSESAPGADSASAPAEPAISPPRPATTPGLSLSVAGKTIQLPPDAQLGGAVRTVLCAPGDRCPATPLYEILRNGERVWVNWLGEVWSSTSDEPLAPAEIPDAFDFVRDGLFPGYNAIWPLFQVLAMAAVTVLLAGGVALAFRGRS